MAGWALPAAGVGAAGMGLANLANPEDPVTHKKKSLLKSMLLGGALGGTVGAGARAAADWHNPAVIGQSPGKALSTLFGAANAPNTQKNPNAAVSVSGVLPLATTSVAGITGSTYGARASANAAKQIKDWDKSYTYDPKFTPEQLAAAKELRQIKFNKLERLAEGRLGVKGGLAGMAVGAGIGWGSYKALQNRAEYDPANNLQNILEKYKQYYLPNK